MTTIWTPITKAITPSWTKVPKPTINTTTGFLLRENGGELLLQTFGAILIETITPSGTGWTIVPKAT